MRKWLLCLSISVLLMSGCADTKKAQKTNQNINRNEEYATSFSEKYMNLSMQDISDEDNLSSLFQNASKEAAKNGYTIILVGENDILKEAVTLNKDTYGSYQKMYEGIKETATTIDASAYFNEQKQLNKDLLTQWGKEKSSVESYEAYRDLYILSDVYYLALLPSEYPYEVFAYISMGGFNDCPDNEILLAVFKHWYEDYGIVPAIITYDDVQIAFTKTLSDKQIKQLAEEILLLNMETQIANYRTKEDMIKGLKHSTYWEFWWD